ncbi:MAG: glycosyltransferase family 61 protein [Acidocella sp.]|nr:glycosyltransferase family 61 protein [Acidocella sp.]
MSGPDFFELLPSPPHSIQDFATWTSLETYKRSLPLAPNFILGGFPPDLARAYYSHTHGTDVGVFTLNNVTVTERGFIRHAGVPVACNYTHMSIPFCRSLLDDGSIHAEDDYHRITVETATILLTVGYDVYGHWLVDFLPKLHILAKTGYDIFKLKYLIPTDIMPYGLKWLHLLGLSDEQFIRYDPRKDIVAVEQLILPTVTRTGHREMDIFPECANFLKTLLDQNAGPTLAAEECGERIFVSRARAGRDGRALTNRAEIEAIAAAHGFYIFHPEILDIAQQVAVFRSARQIVGEYGSGMHGSMFSSPGTTVCLLRGTAYHPGFLQSGLCQVLQQPCGYVFGAAPIDALNYDFTVDPEDFHAALELLRLMR